MVWNVKQCNQSIEKYRLEQLQICWPTNELINWPSWRNATRTIDTARQGQTFADANVQFKTATSKKATINANTLTIIYCITSFVIFAVVNHLTILAKDATIEDCVGVGCGVYFRPDSPLTSVCRRSRLSMISGKIIVAWPGMSGPLSINEPYLATFMLQHPAHKIELPAFDQLRAFARPTTLLSSCSWPLVKLEYFNDKLNCTVFGRGDYFMIHLSMSIFTLNSIKLRNQKVYLGSAFGFGLDEKRIFSTKTPSSHWHRLSPFQVRFSLDGVDVFLLK